MGKRKHSYSFLEYFRPLIVPHQPQRLVCGCLIRCAFLWYTACRFQKGDRFETECFYDTVLSSVGSENVTFGFGSENEM